MIRAGVPAAVYQQCHSNLAAWTRVRLPFPPRVALTGTTRGLTGTTRGLTGTRPRCGTGCWPPGGSSPRPSGPGPAGTSGTPSCPCPRPRWPARWPRTTRSAASRRPTGCCSRCGSGAATCCCPSCSPTATWTGPPTRARTRCGPGRGGSLSRAEPPRGTGAISSADLVLVPAVAVDHSGMRLGRGGGSYDRALARVGTPVPTMALLYDSEFVRHVPSGAHDQRVRLIARPAVGVTRLPRE